MKTVRSLVRGTVNWVVISTSYISHCVVVKMPCSVFTKPAGDAGQCVGYCIVICNKYNELILIAMLTISFTVYDPIIKCK
jgi:hypothetical protein